MYIYIYIFIVFLFCKPCLLKNRCGGVLAMVFVSTSAAASDIPTPSLAKPSTNPSLSTKPTPLVVVFHRRKRNFRIYIFTIYIYVTINICIHSSFYLNTSLSIYLHTIYVFKKRYIHVHTSHQSVGSSARLTLLETHLVTPTVATALPQPQRSASHLLIGYPWY
jgi:hypothetical protein